MAPNVCETLRKFVNHGIGSGGGAGGGGGGNTGRESNGNGASTISLVIPASHPELVGALEGLVKGVLGLMGRLFEGFEGVPPGYGRSEFGLGVPGIGE